MNRSPSPDELVEINNSIVRYLLSNPEIVLLDQKNGNNLVVVDGGCWVEAYSFEKDTSSILPAAPRPRPELLGSDRPMNRLIHTPRLQESQRHIRTRRHWGEPYVDLNVYHRC